MAHQKIALFWRALDNRYQHAQKSEFYARAHVHRLSFVEYDANNNADVQLQQVKDCVRGPESGRPKALFVNPVRESILQGVAREAARQGIGWVSLNRSCDYVTELRREYPSCPFLCVDPDQREAGRLQAQQLRLLLPAGGSVLYLHGPLSTSSARLRMTGFEAALAGCSLRVVATGGDWSDESGFRAVAAWLKSQPGVDRRRWAIGAQNDSMAMGAVRALSDKASERGLGEALSLAITGCDGLASYGQRFVSERALAATVVIPPTAGRAVDEVAAALNGGPPPTADVALGVRFFPELDALAADIRARSAHAPAAPRRKIPPGPP